MNRQPLAVAAAAVALAALCACGSDNNETEAAALMSGAPRILVDLDPASSGATYTIESIAANAQGQLFFGDRQSGNVLRVDPASPGVSVVGRIETRTNPTDGMPLAPNAGGVLFNPAGDLLIAAGPFSEVVRLSATDLQAASPAAAQTFVTGVAGANTLLLDGRGNLYVSGGNTGNVYRAPAAGGAAQVWATIPANSRVVPPTNLMQAVVSNGLALAPSGALWVADTSRGAVWQIPVNSDGSAGAPEMKVMSPLLEGVDGITFDARGRLWGAVNELNSLVVIGENAVDVAYKNDNAGPLEFPSAIVFVGNKGYVSNFDQPRRDNIAADGTTASAGVGPSVAEFQL
jgi:sugar lactone lactonase YvrE